MNTKTQNAKIIFGLKVKQLRLAKKLSFGDLAKLTSMSVSYLNEIEKGKKFPKPDKVAALAEALDTTTETLTSTELEGSLAPVSDLLQSNFLNELPLDLFGIELSKVVEIIANSPTRVGAFISTLVDLSRNYALREENFFFGALRSFLEMHNNYFEDLEQEVSTFVKSHELSTSSAPSVQQLADILSKDYKYKLVDNGLDDHPDLQHIRSVFIPAKKQLLLNSRLNDQQKAFQFGKELGFNYLKLKERANTANLIRVRSFEEALNHFKAGYFSAALLINKESFIADVRYIFGKPQWDQNDFIRLLTKYRSSPEMLFQRLTNVLPSAFGLKKLFLLRFIHDLDQGTFNVDKELHLNRQHQPHSNGLFEHYCRRWISIALLNELPQVGESPTTIAGVQRSRYYGTEDEYLCFTIGRSSYPTPRQNVSMTVGVLIDDDLRQTIRFWNDPSIPTRIVNNTCERCPIEDCTERVVPPRVILKR
ncbi:MAG: XRE family transcriptional regulator, partial [Bacteroidota bacterium]